MQMQALRPAYEGFETVWASLPSGDVEHMLAGEDVILCHGPTNRRLDKLALNVVVAWREVRRRRPDVILSTGAALALPFFLIGRLHGCRTVYVESFTRTRGLSLTGRLVYPIAAKFFVQWPEAARHRRRAEHVGDLLDLRNAGNPSSAVPAVDRGALEPAR